MKAGIDKKVKCYQNDKALFQHLALQVPKDKMVVIRINQLKYNK